VEVLAHGATGAVAELHRWLHRGPRGARVDGVLELEAAAAEPPPAKFQVI